jgi:hypothetical protein
MRLWRSTWRLGRAYSIGFSTPGAGPVRLYSSEDGVRFQVHAGPLFPAREDAEGALHFLPDGTALCLLRGDGIRQRAQLGRSRAPYKAWSWTDVEPAIAGPSLVQLPDGRIAAAGRILDNAVRVGLCWLDPKLGALTEFLRLPSGGEMGSPGLVYHDGVLWVSYHSSHEGRAMIYLARVKPPPPGAPKP